MARSKSPGRKTRSKATEEAASNSGGGGGFDVNDPLIQSVVVVVALSAVNFFVNGAPEHILDFFGGFMNLAATDVKLPISFWPYTLILTGHVLNSCQNSNGGFWIGSLLNAVIAAFGGVIVGDLVNGNKISLFADESAVTLVFLCWYVCNHDLPFTSFNLWNTVSEPLGPAFQKFLGTCSVIFNTNLVIAAAATTSAPGLLGVSLFTPLFMAVLVGAAGQFFPLNKGVNLNKCSAAVYESAAIALYTVGSAYILGNGPEILGNLHGHVDKFCGGHVVLAAVLINHLFGSLIPISPVSKAAGFLKNALNL